MALQGDEKVNANGYALICIKQEYIRTELVLERARARGVKHYQRVCADCELNRKLAMADTMFTAFKLIIDVFSFLLL